MPSEQENAKFLYLLLTQKGSPTIEWDPICSELNLEKGAATKRWSRLKQAMESGQDSAASSYSFLWLMLKNSDRREGGYDWDAIAQACGSTKGAVSKRYSRLKISFERGDAAPSTPSGPKQSTASAKKTPSKAKVDGEVEGTPTKTPKRKRTPASKAITYTESGDEEEELKSKRTKVTPTRKPRPKNGFRAGENKEGDVQTEVKGEPEDDGDVFLDAPEHLTTGAGVDIEGEVDEVLSVSTSAEGFTLAREMTNVLLNRKTDMSAEYQDEIEEIARVFDQV